MQFRLGVALSVFIGSYLPLSLILLVQDYDYSFLNQQVCLEFWRDTCVLPFHSPALSVGMFLVCAICLVVTCASLASVAPKQEILVEEAKPIPADLINYTMPYIVSLMNINYNDHDKFYGFIIFLTWMFWISYKSGQIILNPLLIVLGWRLYDVSYRFSGGNSKLNAKALVKGSLEPGKRYRHMSVQDVLIVKIDENLEG